MRTSYFIVAFLIFWCAVAYFSVSTILARDQPDASGLFFHLVDENGHVDQASLDLFFGSQEQPAPVAIIDGPGPTVPGRSRSDSKSNAALNFKSYIDFYEDRLPDTFILRDLGLSNREVQYFEFECESLSEGCVPTGEAVRKITREEFYFKLEEERNNQSRATIELPNGGKIENYKVVEGFEPDGWGNGYYYSLILWGDEPDTMTIYRVRKRFWPHEWIGIFGNQTPWPNYQMKKVFEYNFALGFGVFWENCNFLRSRACSVHSSYR